MMWEDIAYPLASAWATYINFRAYELENPGIISDETHDFLSGNSAKKCANILRDKNRSSREHVSHYGGPNVRLWNSTAISQ